MGIIVSAETGAPNKSTGDLLEALAKKLLQANGYRVQTEVRVTGAELDLLCVAKANPSREIYVECKAWNGETAIPASVISQLHGTRGIKKYAEAWLISTTDLTKDAKGYVSDIEKSEESRHFMFYTPERLVEALEDSHVICSPKIVRYSLEQEFQDKNILGATTLLISNLGYFWCTEKLGAGVPVGVLFAHAKDGSIVRDLDLLNNLASLETPFAGLSHLSGNEDDRPLEAKDLKLAPNYLRQTEELGMNFAHPVKPNLLLSDVFVFPDLEDVSDKNRHTFYSKTLLNSLESTENRYIIFGEDLAGKTSLARILQKSFNDKGFVPIYISASEIQASSIVKFYKQLKQKFQKQYIKNTASIEAFESLLKNDTHKVPLIIDDFESLGVKKAESRLALVKSLEAVFGHIFIFANKSLELETLAKNDTKLMLKSFSEYRIKQFGHVKRDELIGQWLTVGQREVLADDDILNKKIDISKKISVAAGSSFVPTYPFYLLTMLQVFEMGSKGKLEGTAYAELYGYLVNQSLLDAGVMPDDLDFYRTYLSYVAYQLFRSGGKSFSDHELKASFESYLDVMDLEKSFDRVHRVLQRAKLLAHEDKHYSFYLNYCQYFFTAKYLSDNMDQSDIELLITDIIDHLYRTECANIILFLIHHSKNRHIINGILAKARTLFSDVKPYELSTSELAGINGLIQRQIGLSYQDTSPDKNRAKYLAQKDKLEVSREKIEEADTGDENLDLFERTNLSFKVIDVLGQIANNHWGALEGSSKAEIVEEIHSLGLRALHAFFGDQDNYIEAVRQDLDKWIEEKGISIYEDKDAVINQVIYTFTQLISLVFIKRMAESIGSKNLLKTIEKVFSSHSAPASRILHMATKLSLPDELSVNKTAIASLYRELDKNHLSRDLLRFIVIDHMRNFPVRKVADKQTICSTLDIDYVKTNRMLLKSSPVSS